jgi:hypothetical protein
MPEHQLNLIAAHAVAVSVSVIITGISRALRVPRAYVCVSCVCALFLPCGPSLSLCSTLSWRPCVSTFRAFVRGMCLFVHRLLYFCLGF